MFTKVDTADQFPDDDKINALIYNGLLQRRSICQLGPDLCGAIVGVNAHTCSESKQTLFGTHSTGHIVPFRTANRTQQYTVRCKALLKLCFRQWIAIFVNGTAAHIYIGVCKGVSVKLCNLVQHI